MKTCSLAFALLVYTACFSQQALLPAYNDFIDGILRNHPMARRAGNERTYAELQLTAARGNYDPLLSGSYQQKHFNGTPYFTVLNSEVKQPLFTNQYLKAGYDVGTGPNVNPESYTPSQGLPYVGMEVGVLQGLLIDKRRAEVLKAKAYVHYYTAEQKIQLNNLLYESSQRYFEWLFSAKQIALYSYFMDAARTRLQGVEALAATGERAEIDTVEAAILYQGRMLDMQNALVENRKNANDLSVYMWLNEAPAAMGANFETVDSLELYYQKAKALLAEKLNISPLQNPLLSKYSAYQKVADTDVRLKRELIKPVLNVKYNFLSGSPSALSPEFSTNSYKWGVNMSFPLLLRNPTNEYKMARVVSQNNALELLNKTNELNFKVNALQQTLSILAEQLTNAERSASYSKQLLAAEMLKFKSGEGSIFMINTRETKLLESELKLAEYRLKFIKTVLTLIYLNGSLDYKFQ